MRVAGIIAEYNPFHNGHALHVRRTRETTGCDYVVAVMSGAFTQRGEPAMLDKWTRARMALACGVDAVIELPALYATRTAERFARGGVTLLHALGVATDLSFGCENTDIDLLIRIADALENEDDALKAAIRARLESGQSHARARSEALCERLQIDPRVIAAPNTVLAVEYLRANARLARPMKPLAILRETPYHAQEITETAPAGAIRRAVLDGDINGARRAMPPRAFALLHDAYPDALCRPEALSALALYRLREMTDSQYAALPDLSEGLDKRIKKAAAQAGSLQALLESVKCKRYTMARISRAVCHALIDADAALDNAFPVPPYARVLGFRQAARPLIRRMNEVSAVPIITDPTRLKGNACFALDARATDLWGLTCQNPDLRVAGRDMTRQVVIEP